MQYEAWVFSATPEDTTGDVANENPEDCADSAGEHNHLHIYLSCLFFVCLYSINVKRAQPIGPKFCVGPNMALWKVYECLKFQKIPSDKILF